MCVRATMTIRVFALLCLYAGTFGGPLHASCKIQWNWSVPCDAVQKAISAQIQLWNGPNGCVNGGEKCLYAQTDSGTNFIKATHTTPVKHYVDDLTFNFQSAGSTCEVSGFSTSETWYAVLDSGTNYCNLHNLIIGAGLDKQPGYVESTSNDVCTQYSSANCDIY